MLFYRTGDGVGVAWGRWAMFLAWGLPVWWRPRWFRREDEKTTEWGAGWLLLATGVLRYQKGARWPALVRQHQREV